MARGKYLKDYRLLEYVDERGRVHADYEYIGKPWHFISSPETVRKEAGLVMLLWVVCCALFLLGAIPRSAAMRTWYCSLPFAFTALFLGMLTEGVLLLRKKKPALERREAELFSSALPARFLTVGVLAAVSALGALILTLTGRGDGNSILFLFAAAAMSAAGLTVFSRRKALSVEAGQ